MTHVIETRALTCRFKRLEAVRALDLQVPAGSVFALVGPNGAGKTTLIKMLMNVIRPSGGHGSVLGIQTRRLRPHDFERIGYVSENQALPDWMTPGAWLAYVRPFYPTWDERLSTRWQRDLGLALDVPLKRLSRGTRMKAALLASLAYRPELVVLDEPFTGLDPLVREELIRALLALRGEQPRTVFVSSHDIDEVERLADRIAFLDRGRLLLAEPVASLLARCRLVEVTTPADPPAMPPLAPSWLLQGVAGRTIRFVDTEHGQDDGLLRIRSAYPDADVRVSPLSLREIFVALARHTATLATTAEDS
jgi:ABC-2 type transport system ATP-binding protein